MDGDKLKNILIKTGPLRLVLLIGCAVALALLSAQPEKSRNDEAQVKEQYPNTAAPEEDDAETAYAKKLEECLSYVQGIGRVKVMITFKEKETESFNKGKYLPEVEGVLIIAQGGDDAKIKNEITEAAKVLFGVEAHKIKVMKMN